MSIEIKLAQFEGPLDLLIHLIEKSEMDIQDIRLSEITAQYFEFIPQMNECDLDNASEFLAVAATLVYIKSRSLLPKSVPSSDEGDEDPEQALLRQIREYKVYKIAAQKLLEMSEIAQRAYSRLPEEYPLPPPEIKIIGADIAMLHKSFSALLLRVQNDEKTYQSRELSLDAFTVSEQMNWIKKKLRESKAGTLPFTALFPENGGKMGIIVTFMALLEMANTREVQIKQDGIFEPIEVSIASKPHSLL